MNVELAAVLLGFILPGDVVLFYFILLLYWVGGGGAVVIINDVWRNWSGIWIMFYDLNLKYSYLLYDQGVDKFYIK